MDTVYLIQESPERMRERIQVMLFALSEHWITPICVRNETLKSATMASASNTFPTLCDSMIKSGT